MTMSPPKRDKSAPGGVADICPIPGSIVPETKNVTLLPGHSGQSAAVLSAITTDPDIAVFVTLCAPPLIDPDNAPTNAIFFIPL
jgi:hypothetical protein